MSLIFAFLFAFSLAQAEDNFLWLEGVEDAKALEWVKSKNALTQQTIESSKNFPQMRRQAEKILNAKDKLAEGPIYGDYLYNFWQDEKHVRGLWRRSKISDFIKKKPKWELLLDFDKLAKADEENWVYKGSECLKPDYNRCMLKLSRGGKDAAVYKEFDVKSRKFISAAENGFVIPELKSYLEWIDSDTLLLSTPLNEAGQTDSGYAREVRIWKRGQPLEKSSVVFSGSKSDVGIWGGSIEHGDRKLFVIARAINTLEQESYLLSSDLKKVQQIKLPKKSEIHGLYQGMLIVKTNEDWTVAIEGADKQTVPAGHVVAFDLDAYMKQGKVKALHTLFASSATSSVEQIAITKSHIFLNTLENVQTVLLRKSWDGTKWSDTNVKLKDQGIVYLRNNDIRRDDLMATNTNLLTPTQSVYIDSQGKSRVVQQLPPRFNSKGLMVEQKFATSKDSTKVPFFIVRSRKLKMNGKNPTLLYGYGGFGIAMTPSYPSLTGKLWLEKGGVYVLSNIRGGSEFGPKWHLSAVKENRIKSYEDFIAIAEELHRMQLTSPSKLAIQGGSNGGLLVSTVMVMRPELFGAVVCEVPLTDMLRYTKLLAGASWIGEYGDPEKDRSIKKFWEATSPYQNLKKDVQYPPILFATSTKDDRVHPGHARKMAARMLELGQNVSYFENMEGGHSASANLLQRARHQAIVYTFLHQRLF